MLETALDIPAAGGVKPEATKQKAPRSRAAVYGYSLLVATLVAGWLLSGQQLVNPEEGLGYWLGIVGGVGISIDVRCRLDDGVAVCVSRIGVSHRYRGEGSGDQGQCHDRSEKKVS